MKDSRCFFDLAGDEHDRAALVRALVVAGIEVLEFKAGAENLEQLYFQTGPAMNQFLLRRCPELQRNLWLEFSLPRLLIMPLVIGLVLLGVYEINSLETAAKTASVMVWILLVLWGTRLAAESFTDEVQGRTWDTQRLAASSATSLIVGKLFGGTAYVWYGAALCFIAEVALFPQQADDIPYSVLGGLLGQATSLFMAVLFRSTGARQGKNNSRVFGAQLLGIIAAGWITSGPVARLMGLNFLGGMQAARHSGQTPAANLGATHWYGLFVDLAVFQHCLGILTLVWLIIGATRLVRRDLGYRDGPLTWLAFTLFMVGLFGGFASPEIEQIGTAGRLLQWLIVPLGITLGLSYLALLTQPVTALKLRKLANRSRQRDWRKLWLEIPCWFVSAVLFLVTVILLAVTGKGATVLLALPGFLLRDVIIVYGCRLRYPRRSGAVIGLLILLLYWLGPYVCRPLQSLEAKSTDALSIFLPLSLHWYGIFFPLIEAIVALALFWPSFRRALREPRHG